MSEEKIEHASRADQIKHEDQNYVPVIIKRNDVTRHPYDILERAIAEGHEQHKRSKLSLFLSAIAAGLILGFAAMCVAVMTEIFPPHDNPLLSRFMVALVYPLGFIVCILSGTQLFTEQTATAVYTVLDGKDSISSLHKVWFLVLAGNFVGTFASSSIISLAIEVIGAADGYIQVAKHVTHFGFGETFVSALLAGWLMAQGGWLIKATTASSGQIICIFVVTFIIGIGGLHHSIAGSAEIFSAHMISDDLEVSKSLYTLLSAVLGNLIGGSLFVAVLNYGHIKKTYDVEKN